jgi:hypothetical protein
MFFENHAVAGKRDVHGRKTFLSAEESSFQSSYYDIVIYSVCFILKFMESVRCFIFKNIDAQLLMILRIFRAGGSFYIILVKGGG